MASASIGPQHLAIAARWLQKHDELAHIRVRKQAQLLILESGPKGDPIRHTRLRRIPSGEWLLEMPHRSRWQATPFADVELEPLLDLVRDDFGWLLMKIE